MRRPFAAVAVLGTATAVFSLVGCGGSTSPSQTNFKSLNAGQQAEFENEAVVEVEANVASFVTPNPYGAFGFAHVAPRRGSALAQILAAKTAQRPRFQSSGSCNPTVTGTTTDEDSDNIPDNATATFSCNASQSGVTEVESGTITFADPTPSAADLEFNSTVNLSINETGSTDGDLSLTLAGQSALTQATGLLSEAGNATISLALTNAPNNGSGSLKLQTNSNATYAFTGAQPVSFGSLPDGTFNLTGNWAYDVKSAALTANLSFAISTPGGLVISSSCTSNSGSIESGEIDIKFGDGTLVQATYSGCPTQPTYKIN